MVNFEWLIWQTQGSSFDPPCASPMQLEGNMGRNPHWLSQFRARLATQWTALLLGAVLLGAVLRVGVALLRPLDLSYDEPTFVDLAANLLAGHGLSFSSDMYGVAIAGHPTSFEEPIYPLWLAFLQIVSGTGDVRILRAAQAVFGVLIVLIVYWLGSEVYSRRVGLAAALVVAVWPPLVYFSTFLMSEALYVLLLPLILLITILAAKGAHRSGWMLGLAVGALWGLVVLVRGATVLLLAAALVWVTLVNRNPRRIILPLFIAVGTIAVLVPWWVRNYSVHGAFVPLTTKAGYNLYHWSYPDEHQEVALGEPVPPLGGTEVQRDRAYQQMALAAMLQHPHQVAEQDVLKAVKFYSPVIGVEGPGALTLPYGMALGLVYLGAALQLLVRGRPRLNAAALLWAAVATEFAIGIVFFSNNRARLPVEPLLIVLAVPSALDLFMNLHHVTGLWRRGSRYPLLFPSAAADKKENGGVETASR